MRRPLATGLLVASLAALGCGASPGARQPALASDAALLPARTRRLTNLELERSLAALTRQPLQLAAELPPDVRQEGYTPNASQDVSSAWASRYGALVDSVVERLESQPGPLLPCAEPNERSCRMRALNQLGLRVFRRPLTARELGALDALWVEGSAGDRSFKAGLGLLLRALLQSPSFLYLSELGDAGARSPGERVRLDGYELASELAYTLRGSPPDDELLRAAGSGALQRADQRVAQARRLLALPDTRFQFRRFVLEWLEVDGLLQTAKSSSAFPEYDVLKPFMLAETESYVDEVMVHGGASVRALLASGFASVGPEMARFYGLENYGPRTSLVGSGRLGVLQQASFLAAHAHEDVTSPVKRGDFVMRKLLCQKLKRPAEIGLEVVMPPPSKSLTNRERLSRHIADPTCASCHARLDALGFTFERFDAAGRAQSRDHGRPIDARAHVKLGRADSALLDLDSSAELTRALVEREGPVISECFARHAFRYFSAQADPAVEASFVALRQQLPPERRDNLFEVLLAYIGSDLFVLREVRGE